jgi:serine protease SohB
LQYGLFLAKTLTWVGGLIVLVIVIAGLVRAGREHVGERLDVKNINERLQRMADILNLDLLDEKEYKREEKRQRAEEKAKRKASKDDEPTKPRLFVLDFDGDIEATQVAALREEISAVLQVARPEDAVMVRLESGGGIVHSYGLAASQLKRVRDHGHKLYVSVDKVAASGGYMMACVADQILAAPFAVLGSIGVVAQMPNFHRLLNKHEIDVEMHTAGEYKRTLTMFGENTDAARAKFRQELNEIHDLFKSFVAENRAALAIDRVATGEHWYGTQALELGLIDTIQTSDDFLLSRVKDHDVYEIRYRVRRALREQLLSTLTRIVGFTSARLRDPAGVLHAYSAVEPFKTRY